MQIEDTLPSFTQARAFAVHIFTASGAALALAALIYAVQGKWPAMFMCLGVALIVDGVDGTIARRLEVAEVLPRWSGDVLDLVVDFVTYVFVPAYAIVAGGLAAATACATRRESSLSSPARSISPTGI